MPNESITLEEVELAALRVRVKLEGMIALVDLLRDLDSPATKKAEAELARLQARLAAVNEDIRILKGATRG